MAIFRKIHTSFWSDSFISDLDNDHKLFYIYLMTNERTRQCGVYEITKKQISFDLGYSIDRVSKLLAYFILKGKIRYNDKTNEIAIGNWLKYNFSTSPKVKSCIDKEFSIVKDTLLIEYVRNIDTQSQQEQEQEEEQVQDEKKITPTLEQFLLEAKLQCDKAKLSFTALKFSIEAKYNSWVDAGWVDGHGKKIKNWKSKIGNVLPHLKPINTQTQTLPLGPTYKKI